MAEAREEQAPQERVRVALKDAFDLLEMLPHEDSDDVITVTIARDGTSASFRLPITQAAAFADVLHGGANRVAMDYNAEVNLSRIVAVVVEHRREGGDVGALLAAAFRAYRLATMEPALDPLDRSGSLLKALAEQLCKRHEHANDRAGKLAEHLTYTYEGRVGSLSDRLGRALRAAAEEVGGVEALVGDSPSGAELRRFMEESGRYRSGDDGEV